MFGPTLAGYLADKVGLDLSWWVYSLGAWLLVAILGVLRVDLNGRVLGVLMCAEVAVLLVLAIAGLGDPAAGVPLTSLSPGGLFGHPGIGALLVIALLGYVGLEAAAVFSEEARAPRRTVPVAVYTSLALIGATVLFMTSLFAAMISFHNAVARYMFALGRERVLPGALGRTEPRSGAPRVASLSQSPSGSPSSCRTRWPAGTRWSGLANYSTLLGVPPGSTEARVLPALFAVAAVAGVAYGLWLRSSRPDVYQGIGLGP